MKKTTIDPETPIFRELNKELGELPEIDIHDFDEHAFDFLREYDAEKAIANETADEPIAPEPEPVAVAASVGGWSSRGGRRRKGD